MTRKVKLAVLGAGLIGKRHVEHVRAAPDAELMAIVDPSPTGKALAEEIGAGWAPSFSALIETDRPDGIIIATPNQVHVANGLESVAAGIPALVEKPIADDVDSARKLVEAAEGAGVLLLVGHHRRHNPLVRKAKETIESGRLGWVLAVHGTCWFFKPDDYFDIAWRREKGAGPVFLNLIHGWHPCLHDNPVPGRLVQQREERLVGTDPSGAGPGRSGRPAGLADPPFLPGHSRRGGPMCFRPRRSEHAEGNSGREAGRRDGAGYSYQLAGARRMPQFTLCPWGSDDGMSVQGQTKKLSRRNERLLTAGRQTFELLPPRARSRH
jgi:hypothetical protein